MESILDAESWHVWVWRCEGCFHERWEPVYWTELETYAAPMEPWKKLLDLKISKYFVISAIQLKNQHK